MPRAELAQAVRDRIAGPEFQAIHERIWYTPGPRWFSEQDAIWRIHADASMFVGGISAALLLQSLHPVGHARRSTAHSGFQAAIRGAGSQRTSRLPGRRPPTGRSPTTRTAAIDRSSAPSTRRVRGTTSTGRHRLRGSRPDPHLLGWVHVGSRWTASSPRTGSSGPSRWTTPMPTAMFASRVMSPPSWGSSNHPKTVAELDEVLTAYRPAVYSRRQRRMPQKC